ncbi:MAG: hypothetical protein V3W09_04350 [Nitrososphaerales archaeon]
MPDYTVEDTVYKRFTTRAFATGIPTVLAGTPVVSAYEDDSITQITAGITLGVDHDSVAGLNLLTIVATGANGYEAGKSYDLVITTGTVGGVSVVGEVVWHFTLSAEAAAVDLANGTDGLGAIKAETALIVADTNELQTDWVNGGRLDLLLDDIPTVSEFNIRTGYARNSIWIDTVSGAAGTTDYTHGTESNPVNSIADANTLATSLGISRFEVASGSSITFVAAQTGQVFVGERWTLALGGQNVANSVFIGAIVSGVMAGTGSLQKFINCVMNATSVIKGTIWVDCFISDTQTVVEAGEFLFKSCVSSVAGASAPTFDFGAALNSSNLSVRQHSGGWTIENMGAGTGTYNSTFEGHGQIIWAASCSATSNASIRGHWRITDNAGGAITETKDDITVDVDAILNDTDIIDDGTSGLVKIASDVAAILVDTGTTLQSEIDGVQTNTETLLTRIPDTISLANINAQVDTALSDINLNSLVIASGSVETSGSNTTTQAQTDIPEVTNDHYIGDWILFTSDTEAGMARYITDYVGATGVIIWEGATLATPPDASTFIILPGARVDLLAATQASIDAIESDTNELQTDWADAGRLDTIIDAILVDTGTTLDTKLNDIQGATFSSVTDSLEAIRDRGDAAWTTGAGTGLTPLASGTAQGGTASTIQLAVGETFADDELNGTVVNITGGTGAGQSRLITDYTGATDTADVTPDWTTNPGADSVYEIVAGSANVAQMETDVITAGAIATAGAQEIADALLARDMSAVTGEAARSPLNAFRFLRNKWSISGTTLTVTEEDDSTEAWTATVTTDAAADPVTANDPA